MDSFTHWVCHQCAVITEHLGYQTKLVTNDHLNQPSQLEQTYDSLWIDGQYALSVEEGCNGINMMILFIAFVIGFGGHFLNSLVFLPCSLILIHIANLGRLILLALLNVELEGRGFHFFHKYGFTAVLYLASLGLWYFWVMHWNGRNGNQSQDPDS